MDISQLPINNTCGAIAEGCPILEDILTTDYENEQWKDDATWILTSSFVILTMQSGFGLLEIGSSTAGNEVNTMLKNVADILFGSLAWYLIGYGISVGEPSNWFMGMGDFMPDGDSNYSVDSGVLYCVYLFQLSFAATSATIVSGCIAMRMKFEVYCIFAFYAVVVYSFVAHWVWASNGWLAQVGFHDFAGGGAVHLHGAINGIIAILFVGPRRGRFDGSRPESDFHESSPTSMIFGLFMLWWGWIGFNCGSTFGITEDKWIVAARAGVNTINASAGGGIAALIYSKWITNGRHVRPVDVVNGILAGLVASSPTCAVVHTYDSLYIGFIACWAGNLTNDFLVKKILKLDDPVGALGVHGTGSICGLMAVGLLADSKLPGVDIVGNGLLRGGGFELLCLQVLGMLAITFWSVLTMAPFFYILGVLLSKDLRNPREGLRHDHDQLDPALHGCNEDPTPMVRDEIEKAFNNARAMSVGGLSLVSDSTTDEDSNSIEEGRNSRPARVAGRAPRAPARPGPRGAQSRRNYNQFGRM